MLAFGISANGKARGKAWGKIPNLVTADVKGSAKAEIDIEGKARINDGKFTDVEITKLTGKVSDLRFSNNALKAIHGLIQDCANEYVKSKNNELKKDLKKAIERIPSLIVNCDPARICGNGGTRFELVTSTV